MINKNEMQEKTKSDHRRTITRAKSNNEKKKQADSEKQSQHTEKENTLKQANRLK